MNCYNNYNKIVCPKCQSEQIEITMRRGYTYYYCINCGKIASEEHHVVPLSLGGNDIPSNKVFLCSYCHCLIHGLNKQKRGLEWKRLQAEGIKKAKEEGKYKGRKPIEVDWDLFRKEYDKWKQNKITARDMMNTLGLKSNTFYRRVKQYESNN